MPQEPAARVRFQLRRAAARRRAEPEANVVPQRQTSLMRKSLPNVVTVVIVAGASILASSLMLVAAEAYASCDIIGRIIFQMRFAGGGMQSIPKAYLIAFSIVALFQFISNLRQPLVPIDTYTRPASPVWGDLLVFGRNLRNIGAFVVSPRRDAYVRYFGYVITPDAPFYRFAAFLSCFLAVVARPLSRGLGSLLFLQLVATSLIIGWLDGPLEQFLQLKLFGRCLAFAGLLFAIWVTKTTLQWICFRVLSSRRIGFWLDKQTPVLMRELIAKKVRNGHVIAAVALLLVALLCALSEKSDTETTRSLSLFLMWLSRWITRIGKRKTIAFAAIFVRGGRSLANLLACPTQFATADRSRSMLNCKPPQASPLAA